MEETLVLVVFFAFLFCLTWLSEFFITWLFLRKKFRAKQILYFSFLINLLSWPLANLLYSAFSGVYGYFAIELGVFLAEALLIALLFRIGYWKSLLISFAANLTSAFIGIFWWILLLVIGLY